MGPLPEIEMDFHNSIPDFDPDSEIHTSLNFNLYAVPDLDPIQRSDLDTCLDLWAWRKITGTSRDRSWVPYPVWTCASTTPRVASGSRSQARTTTSPVTPTDFGVATPKLILTPCCTCAGTG